VRKPFRRVVTAAGLDPDQILRYTLRRNSPTKAVIDGRCDQTLTRWRSKPNATLQV